MSMNKVQSIDDTAPNSEGTSPTSMDKTGDSASEKTALRFSFGEVEYMDARPVTEALVTGMTFAPELQMQIFKDLNTCLLVHSEMLMAARVYPIVFAPKDSAMPVAVFSLVTNTNRFVDENGLKENTYYPAAVRRYPFALGSPKNSDDLVLGIDYSILQNISEHTQEKKTENTTTLDSQLFDSDGQPNENYQYIAQFCLSFQNDLDKTYQAVELIEELGLFKESTMKVHWDNGEVGETGKFRFIDTERLEKLEDEQIVKLTRSGAMAMIYAHQVSLGHLSVIGGSLES